MNIKAYLINNQTGASSKKVYGLKGDQVTIINYSLNMRLVEKDGVKFWVNENNLSDVPVQKDIIEINETVINTKSKKKR